MKRLQLQRQASKSCLTSTFSNGIASWNQTPFSRHSGEGKGELSGPPSSNDMAHFLLLSYCIGLPRFAETKPVLVAQRKLLSIFSNHFGSAIFADRTCFGMEWTDACAVSVIACILCVMIFSISCVYCLEGNMVMVGL